MPAETNDTLNIDGEQSPGYSQNSHPDLWPFDRFNITSTEPLAGYVAQGCLAAPNAELALFTGQPFAVKPDRHYLDFDAPCLVSRLRAFTKPKDRWHEDRYDHGNSDEEYRFEALAVSPKTPAIRLASLETIRGLESPEADAVVTAYNAARLVRMRVTVSVHMGGGSYKNSTFDSTFHALHDLIAAGVPSAIGLYNNSLSFFLEDKPVKDFAPPRILHTYAVRARTLARLLNPDLSRIVLRDLSDTENLLHDFRLQLAGRRREKLEWRLPNDELAPKSWHTAFTDRSYTFSRDSYDPRHDRLHWSAVILDYFVNLRETYAQLKDRRITTSFPSIAPKLSAKKLMHMARSLEAIEKPDRKPEPVDITINPDRAVIFIGSNNSGKSFTMEMIAANAQESMMGRKTFARKFESPEFDAIIAIPAELPQETGKSTYTEQLGLLVKAIAEIQAIRAVKPDARIMLLTDELYAGTDENDSAALYRATIEWLSANGVTLIGATNNELVFAPEIAEFISMVDRKPITVLKPEDIVAKRQGIPVLVTAGAPEQVIERAAALCGMDELPAPTSEPRTPAEFTDMRNAHTLGLLEINYRKESDVGKNILLWDFLPKRNMLLNKAKTLERIFGTDFTDPVKQLYRAWFDEMPDDQRLHLGEQLRQLPEALSTYITMEHSFRSDRDRPEEELRRRDIAIIESARMHLAWLDMTEPMLASAPETLQAALRPAFQALRTALTHLSFVTIPENEEMRYAAIHEQIISAVSPFWQRQLPFTEPVDYVSAFFHLDRLFRHHHFCRTTVTNGSGIETTGLFHTGLTYELERKNETVTKNDLKLDGSHPGILLGANASGKTTLAESLGVAAFFALNFGYAPAKTFALGAGIKKTAVLTDYLRDPARPKDSGKWLSRQTQIAAILAAAKDGGYLVVLDEPGEGTNGFEGRATLIALAEYLHAHGNTVVFTTHQHKAVGILDQTTGITAYASGLGGGGRYSFAPGRASSLGLNIAVEEGLLPEIVARAREILGQLTRDNHEDQP